MFQSRNRDAYHFRRHRGSTVSCPPACFNLAIEMLIISGLVWDSALVLSILFQSRNRDAYHFRKGAARRGFPLREEFQSRNRDAYHFRLNATRDRLLTARASFNLAIEMLIISGDRTTALARVPLRQFQSRNRDAYHFRVSAPLAPEPPTSGFNLAIEMLIISG